MIKGLRGASIWSEDVKNLLPFYRDVLGLKVGFESPGFIVLGELGAPALALGTHSEVHGRNADPARPGGEPGPAAGAAEHVKLFCNHGTDVLPDPLRSGASDLRRPSEFHVLGRAKSDRNPLGPPNWFCSHAALQVWGIFTSSTLLSPSSVDSQRWMTRMAR